MPSGRSVYLKIWEIPELLLTFGLYKSASSLYIGKYGSNHCSNRYILFLFSKYRMFLIVLSYLQYIVI